MAKKELSISEVAAILGRKGGLVKSKRKAKSSAANGKLGGRPKGSSKKNGNKGLSERS